MRVLVVDQAAVRRLLPMAECLDVMAEALAALARGQAILPLRQVIVLPGAGNAFAAMPAWTGAPSAVGIKVITIFPGNHGSELDSHQGAVLLFEPERGRLLAILDASAITAIRTAAVSGVATRTLAGEGARDLALLGTGVQAETHLEAMLLVRSFARVRVWSRDSRRAARFVEKAQGRHSVAITVAVTAREAVAGADVVCTVTSAREPVLAGEWLRAGSHINAVGACRPNVRELDARAVARASVFVDRRESAAAEAGDLILAAAEGAIGPAHVQGELGEVLDGRLPGRRSEEEVTLFKSLGLAVEDVAAAHRIFSNAQARGEGTWVELGGERHGGA